MRHNHRLDEIRFLRGCLIQKPLCKLLCNFCCVKKNNNNNFVDMGWIKTTKYICKKHKFI